MTREQKIVKTLQALKDVVVKTCIACEGSPLPECKDEMEMEVCLHHTFLSIIVDAFQDDNPKYDIITSVDWDPVSGTCKCFIQPYKESRKYERDHRFVYCELYTKDNMVVGHRVQIEDVNQYLHLDRYDNYLESIADHFKKLCELEHSQPSRDTKGEWTKHYDALEEDLQRFFYIWYYQNSTSHYSESDCCDIIMQSFDDETRKHYSLKWDDRMDRLKIVFKRADGKRSTSNIDINHKWFVDANITGMAYLTKGMTWIPKERLHELFQML